MAYNLKEARMMVAVAAALAALCALLTFSESAHAQTLKLNQVVAPITAGVLYGNGIATSTAFATTSPTVGYITATSSSLTSNLKGNLTIGGTTKLTALAGGGTLCLHVDNTGAVATAAADCGTGSSGITAIGPTGQTQTGATITIASSTNTINGLTAALTIIGSGNSLTYTPSISGTLTVTGGGTGQGTFTASQLLYGNGTNALSSVATTSLGANAPITFSGTLGGQVGGVGGSFNCTSASSGVTGCLTGTDWNTFNNKQAAGFKISTTSSVAISKLAYFTDANTAIGGVATTTFGAANSTLTVTGTLGALVGGANSTLALNLGNSNSWTVLQNFTLASSSQLSVFQNAYFGGTATSTFDSTGSLTLPAAATLSGAGLSSCSAASSALTWNSSTKLFGCNTISGSGITAIGPTGQTQSGATQTLASSTAAFNGLTFGVQIIGSSNTQTFTPTISGTLNNAGLANSTISGISLGGTLNALTATNSTLTFSGSYDGSAARTVGLNLSTANSWNALINISGGNLGYEMEGLPFAYASSTNASTILGLNAGGNATTSSAASHGVTAIGWKALNAFSGSGFSNVVAVGDLALLTDTTGAQNVAVGSAALKVLTTGTGNTGIGYATGLAATTGLYNTFIGAGAGSDVSTGYDNILLGAEVNTGGSHLTTGGNDICIGYNCILPGGTGATNQLNIGNTIFGTGLTATSSGTTIPSTLTGNIGIGTSTPNWALDVSGTRPSIDLSDNSASTNLQHWILSSMGGNFYIGTSSGLYATSTPPALTITNNGQLSTTEQIAATSTAQVVDWNASPNQVVLDIGTAAVTIGFNNASTSGMTKRLVVCNPPAAAGGAITWSVKGLSWTSGTVPTQTTTAAQCDVWSFIISSATSTVGGSQKIFGAMSAGFQ